MPDPARGSVGTLQSLPAPGPVAVVARDGLVGLGVGRYLLGWAAVAIALGAVGAASVRLRAWLVPWLGAPARLVEATVGVAIFTGVAFVLGAMGGFAGWPLLVGLLVVSLAVERVAAHAHPRAFVMDDEPTRPSGRAEHVSRRASWSPWSAPSGSVTPPAHSGTA